METEEALPRLKAGDLDLLVAYRYLPEDPPARSDTLSITTLGLEPLVLLTHADPTRTRQLELDDFLDKEWISGHEHSPDRRMLRRWAGALGFAPHVTIETEDLACMLAMIRAGLAVGLVPATLLAPTDGSAREVEQVPLPSRAPPLNREILAVTRPGPRPPIIDELAPLIAASLHRARSWPT